MQKRIRYIRRVYIVAITLLLWNYNDARVFAEDIYGYIIGSGSKVIQYDELLGYYQSNSPAYNRCRITYQIEAINSTLANETYNSINNQYIDINAKLAELKSAREALVQYVAGLSDTDLIDEANEQISTIDSQISQYQTNANTAEVNLSDAMLDEKLANFYVVNSSSLLLETQNSLKNDFLKKCYGLILTMEKQDYYRTYSEYLDMVQTVERIKNKKGISGEAVVLSAESNFLKNQVTMQENRRTYDLNLATILKETNIDNDSRISLNLPTIKKGYNLEDTQQRFLSSNMKLKQLQNYSKCYQDYKVSKGVKSAASIGQLDLKIQDYQLQESELRNNILIYVKDAISSYENSYSSYYAARSELKLKTKQLDIIELKKLHKKATELELRQATYEKEAADVAYYQSCCNIMIWQNILDNNIYGAIP